MYRLPCPHNLDIYMCMQCTNQYMLFIRIISKLDDVTVPVIENTCVWYVCKVLLSKNVYISILTLFHSLRTPPLAQDNLLMVLLGSSLCSHSQFHNFNEIFLMFCAKRHTNLLAKKRFVPIITYIMSLRGNLKVKQN